MSQVKAPNWQQVKGAYIRAANLTPERRSEIARKAAKTRWRRYRKAQRAAAASEAA